MYICVIVFVKAYVYLYLYLVVCVYLNIHMRVCICTYIYGYIYTHTRVSRDPGQTSGTSAAYLDPTFITALLGLKSGPKGLLRTVP